jgi:hypothetical protein
MKKLILMLLVASFAAFGSVAYGVELPAKVKSDSTMTKMAKKVSHKPSKKVAAKEKTKMSSKSSKSTKWSKSKKVAHVKKEASAKNSETKAEEKAQSTH